MVKVIFFMMFTYRKSIYEFLIWALKKAAQTSGLFIIYRCLELTSNHHLTSRNFTVSFHADEVDAWSEVCSVYVEAVSAC